MQGASTIVVCLACVCDSGSWAIIPTFLSLYIRGKKAQDCTCWRLIAGGFRAFCELPQVNGSHAPTFRNASTVL